MRFWRWTLSAPQMLLLPFVIVLVCFLVVYDCKLCKRWFID